MNNYPRSITRALKRGRARLFPVEGDLYSAQRKTNNGVWLTMYQVEIPSDKKTRKMSSRFWDWVKSPFA